MKSFRAAKRPIRVLAVDDSAVMRGVLRTLFQQHRENPSGDLPAMDLAGVVDDGVQCLSAVLRLHPDVVVLDLEMPRMHGLDVIERLHIEQPSLPIIMCSSYTERGARTTLDALAMGAADYVMKPSAQTGFAAAMQLLSSQLLPKIAALAGAGHQALASVRGLANRNESAGSNRASTPQPSHPAEGQTPGPASATPVEIVVIGVSTGGPAALETLLPSLPADFPVPILLVQHMPKLFTGALAERLDRISALRVREARDGAPLLPGTVLLAPGDAHMEVLLPGQGPGGQGPGMAAPRSPVILLHQQTSPNHCKPSIDFLFSSAARVYGSATLALVMTGMGSDGLAGSRRIHEAGGEVLTQDKPTSAVWGMPARVFEAGISREPMPLGLLAAEIARRVRAGRAPRPSSTVSAPPPPHSPAEPAAAQLHASPRRPIAEVFNALL
jgi:two-component system chemotaxis response regulator CheB